MPGHTTIASLARAVMMLLLSASPTAAQVVVRVSARGFGVAGAEVSAWGPHGQVAATRSDGAGTAWLLLPRDSRNVFVVVRRLGFVPARLPIAGRDTLSIELSAVASSLPVLAVSARALRCPVRPDPAADSLLGAASAHYARGAGLLYFGWTGRWDEESVTPEERGYGDQSPLRREQSGIGSPVPTERSAATLRDPPPYGVFEMRRNASGEFRQWRFPPFDNYAAEHFITQQFRGSHTFVTLGSMGDATIIGFCTGGALEADIEGELEVGSDSTLRAARWRFIVSHDDEDAGGEVTFGAAPFEGRIYLVAVRGSSWRRGERGRYNQQRFTRTAWRLGRSVADVEVSTSAPRQP
jgi:hypothetical protein